MLLQGVKKGTTTNSQWNSNTKTTDLFLILALREISTVSANSLTRPILGRVVTACKAPFDVLAVLLQPAGSCR
jgi:hypothetical protein